MPSFSSHLEVLSLLPKTNCRECRQASCLAFAVAVFQGKKTVADCPYWAEGKSAESREGAGAESAPEKDQREALEKLQKRVREIDLARAADRCGGLYHQGKLTLLCLGKPFSVDSAGVIYSDCHVNRWVAVPLLNYILDCTGREPRGEWLPLRETRGGADWWRLFEQRCEKPLKKVIDDYTELLELLVEIFAGEPAPDRFDSDIAIVLHPLPRLPLLLCYWKSEEGLESSLHLFLDVTAEENLRIEAVYALAVGLVTMFEKIAQTHGK
ncbi:MAG: DUF3786 domain-containing protein [Desulfobacterota bacterium]|jgi:hypothetical protein|nr:DUF3786 domain-containing protein [Thermodesulfobacteriota bacterium]